MKNLFVCFLVFLVFYANGQDSCQVALEIKSYPTQTIILNDSFPIQNGPNYGCLYTHKYSFWFYGRVTYSGNITMKFESLIGRDLDMVAWGPFSDPVSPCIAQLNSAKIVDCDYSTNASTEANISNALSGNYYLILLSDYHFPAFSPDTIQISQSNIGDFEYGLMGVDSISCIWPNHYFHKDICYVTNDSSTNKNTLIWNTSQYPMLGPIDYLIIKKENTAMVYDSIGIVSYNDPPFFVDNITNPLVQSALYKISYRDTCGNESNLSPPHKTIHLTASLGIQGQINLNWNQYEGFSYNTHYIYRSSSTGVYEIIDSVSYNITSYTDINAIGLDVEYRIGIKPPAQCSSNKSNTAIVFSNACMVSNGVPIVFEDVTAIPFPNPFYDYTNITFSQLMVSEQLKLTDMTGKTVKEINDFTGKELKIFKENLSPGIYFLKGSHIKTTRLVLM